MSKAVEQKVVEMRFDNRQFESNVQTTLSTLDKLKQKLQLTDASKGFDTIGYKAKNVNLASLSSAIESLTSKFNALQVMGVTALANITNSAVNTGKHLISALTIDPTKSGFGEYETKINAIQTILSNTANKGTKMDDVTKVLGELNTYADKTIYNFAEMTRNIGTFTAAGIGLEQSASSIKGIANLAAASGSSSQQASTAMYQLSQAMAAGSLKLQDWNSVVNAGMGGQKFQEALKATARSHGVAVDKIIKNNGSFRESLKDGWVTTEILNETLSKFTVDGAKKYTESMLKARKMTKAQADALMKEAQSMEDAATKVKTFTQLWDTLKESAQSGWAQSWEIIIGNFEEAKTFLTEVSDTIGGVIGKSAEARNDVLQGWKDLGGRTATIEALRNVFEAIVSVVTPIREAFQEIFPPITAKQLANFSEKLKELTSKLILSESTAKKVKNAFKGAFAVIDIGVTFVKKLASAVIKLLSNFTGIADVALNASSSFGEFLIRMRDTVKESNLFGRVIDKITGFLQKVIDKLKEFAKEYIHLGGFVKVFMNIFDVITKLGSAIGKALVEIFRNGDLQAGVDLFNSGVFGSILLGINKFIKSLTKSKEKHKSIIDYIKDILNSLREVLEEFQQSIKANTLIKIATAIGILAASLWVLSTIDAEQMGASIVALGTLMGALMGTFAIFKKVSADMKGVVKASVALQSLATALLILAVATKIMSTMDWKGMGVGLISTVVCLGALVGAVNLLPEKDVKTAAKSIKTLSSALLLLAVSMKIMSTMSWEEMGIGLISMVVGLGALVGAVNLLPKDAAPKIKGMIGLSVSLLILSGALKVMASMGWEEFGRSMAVMGSSLVLLVGALAVMSKISGMGKSTLAVGGIAVSLVVLAGALKIMASMSWEEFGRSMAALGGSLILLVGALAVMSKIKNIGSSVAAIAAMSASLILLATAIKILGSMSWEQLAIAAVAVAGAFTIMGVAAALMTPVAPILLTLAGAFALFGVGTVALGVGLGLVAAGFTALAVAVAGGTTAIVAGLSSIILGIAGLVPQLIGILGQAILALCTMIMECAPTIVSTIAVVLVQILQALVKYTPTILQCLIDLLLIVLNGLSSRMGELIGGVVDFLVALILALAQHIGKLIDAFAELFKAIFQGIADTIGGVIETILGPILEIFGNIIVGIVEALAPYMPEITEMFTTIAQIVSDAIVKIIEVLAPFMPNIEKMVQAVTEGVKAICDAFTALVQEIAPIIESISELITDLGDAISKVFDSIAEVVDSVGDSIKKVLDGIAGVIESIGKSALDAGTGFENMANGVKTITKLKLADMVASLAAVAKGLKDIAKNSKGISEVGTGMSKISNAVKLSSAAFATMATNVNKLSVILVSLGPTITTSMNAFTTGIVALLRKVEQGSQAVAHKALAGVNSASVKSGFVSAGKNFCQGLINGLRDKNKRQAVYNAAYSLGKLAVQGELDGQKSASPSKATIQAGKWLGEGLVIGINRMGNKVSAAGQSMGETATNSVSTALNTAMDLLNSDMDSQPTIRPVLDLSDVESGAGYLNSMFNNGPSVGVMANLSAISAGVNTKLQNGANGDVVSAINKLRKDLGNVSTGDTYNFDGITYDNGSELSDAVRTIVRAAKVERRI